VDARHHLIKHLYSSVNDLQLQEFLSQVLDPEVDGACIEVLQEQHCTGKDADADDVKQLVAFQAAAAFPAQLSG